MYERNDGRKWSTININDVNVEMLWDSGASVTVMSEKIWIRIGKPRLDKTHISLCGVFSSGNEKPKGVGTIVARWNGKMRNISVIVVSSIRPDFIGGVDTMKCFGIQLTEVYNIEASLVNNAYSNEQRLENALRVIKIEDNKEMIEMIKKFSSIFMASKFDLGYTELVRHEMKVEGKPVNQTPRRQPMHVEQKVDNLITELIKANVIRKCTSAWNAPLVIVAKRDGSIRMCVDYRGLNAVTEREVFPMPDTRFLLDCLASARYFSSIDLGQAYYQVGLAPSIQKCSAFSTRQGQFCFNRLPFGLSTAPATFQRLMHILLKGMLFEGVVVYLDDILIYGKSKQEHDNILEEVFRRIQNAGLKVNPEKCEIFKNELIFLGHTVSERGIRTNGKNIQEIKEAEIPRCAKQLRSFLGMTNYYRRFIKEYAKIAAPLYAAITGCEKKIRWTRECDDSFQILKARMCEAPILDYPRMDRTFILDTDASFGAIGAVLSQIKEDGSETVIAYGSRHLTTHEKGYCVTRKELLAVHEYVTYFKQYLYGKKFIVRTDHKALIFMSTTKKAISPQFQTWISNLSEYDFDLKYRKGEEHLNADGMSRIKGMLCSQCQTRHEDAKEGRQKIRHINVLEKTEAMSQIMVEQTKDPKFQEIFEYLQDKGGDTKCLDDNYIYKLRDHIKYENGLLTMDKDGGEIVLVPEHFSRTLVIKVHKELCHVGVNKMVHYMSTIFFWPKMKETIQESLKTCMAKVSPALGLTFTWLTPGRLISAGSSAVEIFLSSVFRIFSAV